ncbi:MAG: hypothetical protein IKX62_00395 [Bacteroidales bacterium]|nr:hypothetical protein [Bacteroidales bacterium]
MRRNSILFLICCLWLLLSPSELSAERLRERVYVATDRDVYVAGDAVWMSAWCVDATSGLPSEFSKIAYVEIHSAQGLVQTAKIALEGGRGAGRLTLPNTLPTGNYRLLSYTKLGASEEGFDPLTGARTLSVVNTLGTDRIPDGVKIIPHARQKAYRNDEGSLQIRTENAATSGSTRIRLSNSGSETIRFSLGVRHDDGIPAPDDQPSITDFTGALRKLPAARGFDPQVIPEYEGEVIRVRVSGTDEAGRRAQQDKYAFISSPGGGENLYTEDIHADGTATFFTTNIYGSQNMFLEIEDPDPDNVCHLEIVSPFLNLDAGDIPPLELSAAYAPALEMRNLGMQLERNFDADTLYSDIPVTAHRILDRRRCERYVLDDYTRFPVMEELFIEFISQIRLQRSRGKREIQIGYHDVTDHITFPKGRALLLLDGIPVLDHEKIISYDPLLVRYIDIYDGTYAFGARTFCGIANFVTYKGTLPSIQFEDNVRIVDFQGCPLPTAYTCEGVDRAYPDYRQTIYWHPLLTISPGETMEIECKTPDYGGRFEVVAEGLTAQGEAVLAHAALDVR